MVCCNGLHRNYVREYPHCDLLAQDSKLPHEQFKQLLQFPTTTPALPTAIRGKLLSALLSLLPTAVARSTEYELTLHSFQSLPPLTFLALSWIYASCNETYATSCASEYPRVFVDPTNQLVVAQ
jgi:hypothetical protein